MSGNDKYNTKMISAEDGVHGLPRELRSTPQQPDQSPTCSEDNPQKPKLLENFNYRRIDGLNYLCPFETKDIGKVFPLLPDLKLREDDVFLAAFPKSGNHWVFEILQMILRQSATFVETVVNYCFVEIRGEDVQQKIDAIPTPRVLGTHLRPRRFPRQVLEKRLKTVCMIRNPKDVAVSLYVMMTSSIKEGVIYNATFGEFFNQFFTGEFMWGSWFDHVLAMEKFLQEHPDHPVFVVSYERMKESPVEVIKELCAFLEKPDSLAEDIANMTEMSNMKTILMRGKEGRFQKDRFKPDSILRKGIVGGWREWLTVRQSEIVDKLFQEKMRGSKLGDLVKYYI